eukprot:TRINITY_DN88033_c0_g1_i1.p1 TRINITY_DN88033_c0_g1~~TRINITY_DN88033_c0_g1_i1.p1  ORF type:complete len:225 (+),score=16.95 TRINITY_DN88033_c0_g1_i1:162-836(+)
MKLAFHTLILLGFLVPFGILETDHPGPHTLYTELLYIDFRRENVFPKLHPSLVVIFTHFTFSQGFLKKEPYGLVIGKQDTLTIDIDKLCSAYNFTGDVLHLLLRHNREYTSPFHFKVGPIKFRCQSDGCYYFPEGSPAAKKLDAKFMDGYLFLKLSYKTRMEMRTLNVSTENGHIAVNKAMTFPTVKLQAKEDKLVLYELGVNRAPYNVDLVMFCFKQGLLDSI